MLRRTVLLVSLSALAAVAAGAPSLDASPAADARRGPPWISIEHPPSPYDAATRDAFLLVHAYRHGTPTDYPVSGTAEGIVDGRRQSIPLRFTRTSRAGTYALRRQWPAEGRWVLSLGVAQGDLVAGALVTLGADGRVASVQVPTHQPRGYEVAVPRAIGAREVEAALRGE